MWSLFTVAESRTTVALYSLVAESAAQQMCRQNLRYRYLIKESTEVLLLESTNILEHVQSLSVESRNIQTQNCAPIQCTVWPRKDEKILLLVCVLLLDLF